MLIESIFFKISLAWIKVINSFNRVTFF